MRIKQKKYIICLLISIICFTPNVQAISFVTNSCATKAYNDNNLNHTTNSKNGYSNCVKYVGGTNNYAFCSNEGKDYSGNGSAYAEIDQGYANANTCSFSYNGTTYTNGDCSRIIGYIIKHALKNPAGETDTVAKEWMRAQASIWIYLANFVPQNEAVAGFNVDNAPSKGRPKTSKKIWEDTINPSKPESEKNKFVKKVFEDAWKEYYENHYMYYGGSNPTTNNNYISITHSEEFYYIPNKTNENTKCNIAGVYRTKTGTITNLTTESMKVEINTNSSTPLKICTSKDGVTNCQQDKKTIVIPGNNTINIYFESDKYLQPSNKITFIASYDKKVDTSKTNYDSERWQAKQGYQSMLYMKIDNQVEPLPTQTIEKTYIQQPMSHKTCPSGLVQNTNSLGTQNNPAGRKQNLVCAGRNKSNEIYKLDNSTIGDDLTYCTCTTIHLGDGDYVNVTLTQNMAFKYGYVTPTTIYSGGGFELSSNTGITTDYLNVIMWDYSDYLGGIPYYYNAGEEYSTNSNTRDASTIKDKISEAIYNQIIKGNLENLEIVFNTYDSNSVDEGEGISTSYKTPMKNNVTYNYNATTQTFEIKIEKITLKEAFFNGNGEVSYQKDDNYYISGGNKYYVPLYYKTSDENKKTDKGDSIFEFNISPATNLSLVDGIKYHIEAGCNVLVTYNIPEIRYRPITVEEPFPKGESSIPENWVEWWRSTSFQKRVRNTYKNLDYKLEITKEKEQKILEINKKNPYTEWNYMKDNGSSNFIKPIDTNSDIDLGFETKPNITSSYCPLGESDYIKDGTIYPCKK